MDKRIIALVTASGEVEALPYAKELTELSGYNGNARWVALYWGGGDELYWDDGRASATGDYEYWLYYTGLPPLMPVFHHIFDFGSSEADAEHWFLVDREEDKAYAGPWQVVARHLAEQWRTASPNGEAAVDEEQTAPLLPEGFGAQEPSFDIMDLMRELMAAFEAVPVPTEEEITAAMEERRRKYMAWVEKLQEWPPMRKYPALEP